MEDKKRMTSEQFENFFGYSPVYYAEYLKKIKNILLRNVIDQMEPEEVIRVNKEMGQVLYEYFPNMFDIEPNYNKYM